MKRYMVLFSLLILTSCEQKTEKRVSFTELYHFYDSYTGKYEDLHHVYSDVSLVANKLQRFLDSTGLPRIYVDTSRTVGYTQFTKVLLLYGYNLKLSADKNTYQPIGDNYYGIYFSHGFAVDTLNMIVDNERLFTLYKKQAAACGFEKLDYDSNFYSRIVSHTDTNDYGGGYSVGFLRSDKESLFRDGNKIITVNGKYRITLVYDP